MNVTLGRPSPSGGALPASTRGVGPAVAPAVGGSVVVRPAVAAGDVVFPGVRVPSYGEAAPDAPRPGAVVVASAAVRWVAAARTAGWRPLPRRTSTATTAATTTPARIATRRMRTGSDAMGRR